MDRPVHQVVLAEDTKLEIPLEPLDRVAFMAELKTFRTRGKPPLALSLRQAARDLASAASAKRPMTVVLLTDGGEDTQARQDPLKAAAKRKDARRIEALEREAEALLAYAKRFTLDGEECIYWEKPLEGAWTPEWGGKPATTLHNANGFAAGRLFLGLWRDRGKSEYLPIVDGVFNWAKRIAWTRNEFADVPSSPFAIGGTLSGVFIMGLEGDPTKFEITR